MAARPLTQPDCVSYPVESPLEATYDAATGELTLESSVLCGPSDGQPLRLRLVFTPEAAHGFVHLLRQVEEELDVVVASQGSVRRLPN
jgi:hypothetical protein